MDYKRRIMICIGEMCVKLAEVLILTVLLSSQECSSTTVPADRVPAASNRKLLQSDPPALTAPPLADTPPSNAILLVDQSGRGDFTSVQAAVNAVPVGNPQRVVIRISAGNYVEKVVVPQTLPHLTFQGAGVEVTSITWNDIASNVGSDGRELTSYNSASVMVFASYFIARDISFRNTAPPPPPGTTGRQGAAFRISADMAAFYNCAFYGAQDTLCDDSGRHYFKNCSVEGSIDFIFGNGQSLYMASTLRSIAASYGSIAAQDRQSPSDPSGFSFVGCQIMGSGYNYLGRAMGPYSRIVYSECYMENMIAPEVWDDWDHDTSRDGTVTYGMYQCWGPGANQSSRRVPWAHDFNQVDVMPYTQLDFINGQQWLTEV